MYKLIQFPEIQKYQELLGFDTNSCLANDEFFLKVNDVSDSAYFIHVDWLTQADEHLNRHNEAEQAGMETNKYLEQ